MKEVEGAEKLALHIDERLRDLVSRKNSMAALVDIGRELAAQRDLDTLVATLVRRARVLLSVDLTCLTLQDASGRAVIRATEGTVSALGADCAPVPAVGEEYRGSVWTVDWRAEGGHCCPGAEAMVDEEGIAALLSVPLRGTKRIIGTLYAGDRDKRTFTASEIGLATSLCDYAAAVEQLYAMEELHRRNRELQASLTSLHEQAWEEQWATDIGRKLLDLVVDSADVQDFVDEASRVLNGAVWFRSATDVTLARSEGTWDVDEDELRDAVFAARTQERTVELGGGFRVAPLRVSDQDLGTLVLHCALPDKPHSAGVLHHVVRAAALLARFRDADRVDDRIRSETLGDLISGTVRGDFPWARRLGFDPDRPHVVAVTWAGDEAERLVRWASTYARWHGGVHTLYDGHLVLLLPQEGAKRAASEMLRELGRVFPDPMTVGGAPVVGGCKEIPRAYQEAIGCLEALTSLGREDEAATIEELGFVGVLLGDNRDVRSFIDATLGPVLAHDTERSTELAATLVSYFAAGSSPTYAATELHVHPNTVLRRLEKISTLLGPDWQQPGPALEIQLALRLHQVRVSLGERDEPAG